MNYNVIMQSSINKSTRITIQNLSADIATFNGFSMAQLVLSSSSWDFHSFLSLLFRVVTFNFKFSKIITALLTFNSFFLFQFSSSAARQLKKKKIYCVRMDGKFVSGTKRIVRVHLCWIDYIKRIFTEAQSATEWVIDGIRAVMVKNLFYKVVNWNLGTAITGNCFRIF